MYSDITTSAFPSTATSKLSTLPQAQPKVESKPDTPLLQPSFPDKLTLPSNECGTSPKLSESSIQNTSAFTLSGLGISFGKTLPYLPHKTVTRRTWKDNHAQKFINAFHHNKLVKALDRDIRYGGKQIGWCRLLCAPYKEQLAAMPEVDLQAEGGMCDSIKEFVQRYFQGNSSLEVWVIRFEFIATGEPVQIPTAAMLGVYSDSVSKADSHSVVTSLTQSIHQALLLISSVCDNSVSTTDSKFPITLATDSIHQTLTLQGGSGLVYSFWKGESIVNHYRYKVKTNGKWQVKSIYIPVGKLPKVREAIANKLSVAAIVVEVLGKQL